MRSTCPTAALQTNGNTFDERETRTAIADLIVKFAQQGERDPQKLKALEAACSYLIRIGFSPRENRLRASRLVAPPLQSELAG